MADSRLSQQQNRILIIDDDHDITISLQLVSEEFEFRTDLCTYPVLSYEILKDGQNGLMLLDINMPVVDEFLLYQRYWIDFK